ncbi:MAG TPA: EfeM/EfeO family lipoprotein [Polyangiaceae bacterium]|nr:EfeM/EfeO family lipoprotein [Polyangiaceae bacterium]
MRHWSIIGVLGVLLVCGCSDDSDSPAPSSESRVTSEVHSLLLTNISALHESASQLQAAAPAHAWDAERDAEAISQMTEAWLKARSEYEHIEGAVAPLFAEIDVAIDARYEDFLETLGKEGDGNLFDDEGVTGMHAVERILFAKEMPDSVVQLESSLPGYTPAAWPSTDEEAVAFKKQLCARLVADTQELLTQWKPSRIAVDGAFRGLIGLMNEQREKVNKASTQEEESRYAQRTMADLRDNLAGTEKVYGVFQSWILSKSGGAEVNEKIERRFGELKTTYASVKGNAFPAAPATWSAEDPSPDDLATPFGKLYSAVHEAVDPNREDSLVSAMNEALVLLGYEEFVEE